jgi:hypothetical protein
VVLLVAISRRTAQSLFGKSEPHCDSVSQTKKGNQFRQNHTGH